MASISETLTVKLEMSEELKEEMRSLADEIAQEMAVEYAKGFEARIRSIVYDAMREREVRLTRQA